METQEIADDICTLIIPKHDEGHAELKWKKGEAEIDWDKADKKDVDFARENFTKYKALGYAAYRVDPKNGGRGEVLKEFDASAQQIVMVPPFAGG